MRKKCCLIFLMISLLVLSCGGGGGGGGGGGSADVTATAEPPASVISAGGNAQIMLIWGSSVGASSYNIYWSTATGVAKATGTKIAGVSSPYYHTGLTNGTTYYYVVTAVNEYGESAESKEASATPSANNPPLPPHDIAALAGHMQVILRWTGTEGATSFNLYWSTTSGVTKATGNKIANATSPYTHTDLANGTAYYYVVTAVNNYGESAPSEEVSTIPNQGDVPSPPSGVSATAGEKQVTLSWNAAEKATSYNIYWSKSADVSRKSGTQIPGIAGTSYTHSQLAWNTTHYYVVTAVNSHGESSDSERVSATTPVNTKLQDVCVAMGDSITAGYGVNYSQSYVPLLSAAWGKTVYNRGVSGVVSSYGAGIIDSVLAQYNPKYITIFYGNNDDGFYNPSWTIGNLRYIIRQAKTNGTKPVVATLTPVFGEWAWRKSSLITLNQQIRSLAASEGIACADMEASFGWNQSLILSDGMHPNSAGHQIIANTFRGALTR